jgi:hypothetical protein
MKKFEILTDIPKKTGQKMAFLRPDFPASYNISKASPRSPPAPPRLLTPWGV